MIFMIIFICHSELVSESPDNNEILKQVPNDTNLTQHSFQVE